MTNRLDLACQVCGFVGLDDGSDGFFYCQRCGSQNEEIRDTAVENDDMLEGMEGHMASMVRRRVPTVIKTEPVTQSQPLSQFWETLRTQEDDNDAGDGVGPTEPSDFGTGRRSLRYEDYYSEIRLRYVMGVQIMIELQVKALVEKFNVSPLIVGMVEPIWLRFVSSTGLFTDDWADEVINESESQKQGEADEFELRAKYSAEPHNILGKRSVMIWYQSVSKTIPLSYSLAISFLVCHMAREAILSKDIVKWTLEGKLPYFSAFLELEKQIGPPSNACPLSSSRMFRPTNAVSSQKLESLAASIAYTVGLELPPVNFYAIASRYLRQLSLPVGNILPHACRIFEWSMPPELWLSANEFRLPTRAFVMSILVVSIRILYNINGFGKWERALSHGLSSSAGQRKSTELMRIYDMNYDTPKLGSPSHDLEKSGTEPCSSPSNVWKYEWDDQDGERKPTSNPGLNDYAKQRSHPHGIDDSAAPCSSLSDGQQSELDVTELLLRLEAKYSDLVDTNDYSEDLPTYLQYCKNVVFAGLELPFEDHEEEKIIEDLWDFYLKKEGVKLSDANMVGSKGPSYGNHKRPRNDDARKPKESKKFRDNGSSNNSLEDCSQDSGTQISINSDCQSQAWVESHKERAIRRMKSNMEENRFCYIPPRVNVKRYDYLHYTRKKDEGAYTYAAHADYFILLRACARVAQLDIRIMHTAVLSFEKRLAFLEKNIDHCLKTNTMYDYCEFCCDEAKQNVTDYDSMDFSKLNL